MFRISSESAKSILEGNLNMRNIVTKFTSCLLGDRLKVNHVTACQDSQAGQEREPALILTTMINDETWVYKHNTETKQQLSSPHQCEQHAHYMFSPPGIHGAVYYTFTTPGQTVNQHYYTDTLQHLWEKWQNDLKNRIMRIGFFAMKMHLLWSLCLVSVWISGCKQNHFHSTPSYSPQLLPCDFLFFPKPKPTLEARITVKMLDIHNKIGGVNFGATLIYFFNRNMTRRKEHVSKQIRGSCTVYITSFLA